MKLYSHPLSPNGRKVLIVAAHLGVKLEIENIDVAARKHQLPEYLKLNPNALFPTLQDGDFVLWESNAITQYIASKKPGNTLYPRDERMRADIAR